MSEAQSQGVPRRVILLIVLGALLPFIAAGVTLYMTLVRKTDPQFEAVQDYLATPQVIPERIKQAGDELRRVDVKRGNIEIYDVGGQRYTFAPNGNMMRRGGSIPVAGQSFRVDDIDFDKLPAILAATEERTGAKANRVRLEYVGEELLWMVAYSSEDGANQLYFTPSGEPRVASNAK